MVKLNSAVINTKYEHTLEMKQGTEISHYNATDELIRPNLSKSRRDKTAVIDHFGSYTYSELNQRINHFANALKQHDIHMEQRIILCLLDTVDFPVCFLGAIRAGVIPVPVNTLLTTDDYEYILTDSRARLLIVSEELSDIFEPIIRKSTFLNKVIVSGNNENNYELLSKVMDKTTCTCKTAPTRPDDVAFWLYTSGTTGRPKGVVHLQTDLMATAKSYANTILQISERDIFFSAAKLFFAYGLGNGLTFPFSVGGTTILLKDRPTPESVLGIINKHQPTLFFGVPTLYAMMLNNNILPEKKNNQLRLCISAGEALPENILARWMDSVGTEILDGIGSTEMLHIFISNRIGDICPGTSGKVVEGYQLQLLDEDKNPVKNGDIGDLYVNGPSSATGYWNQREKSRETFNGRWTQTGDKYICDENGYFIYCGRSDDLLKVGGIYVSPMEVENILLGHPAVAEVAVVAAEDNDHLVKPKAFVVVSEEKNSIEQLEKELITYVREHLAEYKRPRWVEFVEELPKTATGKIQRFKLRQQR